MAWNISRTHTRDPATDTQPTSQPSSAVGAMRPGGRRAPRIKGGGAGVEPGERVAGQRGIRGPGDGACPTASRGVRLPNQSASVSSGCPVRRKGHPRFVQIVRQEVRRI